MRQPTHQRFTLAEPADVGVARRAVCGIAGPLAPTDDARGRAELVATELGTNLVRHGGGGTILARPLPEGSIEIIAVDSGPGIADPHAALEARARTYEEMLDGNAGIGCGLAAVRRASTRFDMYSRPGRGTAVLSVVAMGHTTPSEVPPPRTWAGVSVAIDGACGDGWAVDHSDGVLTVALVDGLGHGPMASESADRAIDALDGSTVDLAGFVERANQQLRQSRGAAMVVGRLHPYRQDMDYVSAGNISGRVLSADGHQGLLAFSGTLGMTAVAPRSKVTTYACAAGSTVLLWTDGVSGRVELSSGDDLLDHDPALVAACVLRDYGHDRDDATVVVVRAPELS